MHRSLFGLGLALLASGCSCGDVTLTIVEPDDGATFNLASDVDEDTDGVQIVAIVATEGLDLGTSVALTAGSRRYSADVEAGGVANFVVELEDGENVLVASAEGEKSGAVTVTLDTSVTECPTLSISDPQDGAVLTEADDQDDEPCGEFRYTVVVATTAQDGRAATLYSNGGSIGDAEVAGAEIRFQNVVLNSGPNDLEVRLEGEGDCSATASASVNCGVDCSIIEPVDDVLSSTDDADPDEPGLQVLVRVDTDEEAGTEVTLTIDDSGDSQSASAEGGEAVFDNVGLAEGERVLQATCTDADGNTATSARVRFTVDSIPPDVQITEPGGGATFSLGDDYDDDPTNGLQVRVCATSSEDGEMCASMAGGDPGADGCADVSADGEACGVVTCNGDDVDLEATVTDGAGNVTSETVTVSCDAGVPVIRIVDPVAGQELSSADDEQPGLGGLQYDVRVCTDAVNEEVTLLMNGGSATTATATDLGDCDGLDGTALFQDATLLEGVITLRAEVTDDNGNVGVSPDVTVTVDSQAPSLLLDGSLTCPLGAVSTIDDEDAGTAGIQVGVTGFAVGTPAGDPVTGTLTNSDGVTNLVDVPGLGGAVDFGVLTFRQGENTISFNLIDDVGNQSDFTCVITGNEGGYIRITSPGAGFHYTAQGDGNAGAAGYQGAVITVETDSPVNAGVSIQVYADNLPVGAPQLYDNAGGINIAVDLPEGVGAQSDVVLRAETVGHALPELVSASVTVQVDTLAPSQTGDITPSIVSLREGTVRLSFPAPEDPVGRPVELYQVRWKSSPFVGENDGTPIGYSGDVALPRDPQVIDITGLSPGASKYFAVRGVDALGNAGASKTAGIDLSFRVSTLDPPAPFLDSNFGGSVAGGGDVNGDGIDDVVVGSLDTAGANRADIFFGHAVTGLDPTPNVTITSAVGFSFGVAVAMLDWDGDGVMDVAVSDNWSGANFEGTIYVFLGGVGFNPDNSADADVTITGAGANEFAGTYLANAGDVDDDGNDDLLISGDVLGQADGIVYLVRGGAAGALALPGAAALRISGPAGQTRFGGAIGPAGDVNGDGFDDFVIGSCRADLVGAGYLYLGETAAAMALLPDRTSADRDFAFADGAAGDLGYGCAVGGVGDVTGDGDADVVVGIPNRGPSDRGGFRLFTGDGLGAFVMMDFTNDFSAEPEGDNLGIVVAATLGVAGRSQPSVDPTAGADLVVGQYRYSSAGGRLDFFWGGAGLAAGDVALAPGFAPQPAGASGLLSLGYAGDVNDDGRVDLLMGDPYVTAGGFVRAGRAYLVY